MAGPHSASAPLVAFGRALRKWRTSAGLTAEELAECLISHGFSAPEFNGAQQLAQHIRQIETGGLWPFAARLIEPFIALCAVCLAGGNSQRQGDIAGNLSRCFAADALALVFPDQDFDLGRDDP